MFLHYLFPWPKCLLAHLCPPKSLDQLFQNANANYFELLYYKWPIHNFHHPLSSITTWIISLFFFLGLSHDTQLLSEKVQIKAFNYLSVSWLWELLKHEHIWCGFKKFMCLLSCSSKCPHNHPFSLSLCKKAKFFMAAINTILIPILPEVGFIRVLCMQQKIIAPCNITTHEHAQITENEHVWKYCKF